MAIYYWHLGQTHVRVWKMTAISLEVFKWAEWDIVFLWQEDKRCRWDWEFSSGKKIRGPGGLSPIPPAAQQMPLRSPFHKVRLSQRSVWREAQTTPGRPRSPLLWLGYCILSWV